MEFLDEIFLKWTEVVMSDTILLSFAFILVVLIILAIIDAFR
jgi:hypothetical protein